MPGIDSMDFQACCLLSGGAISLPGCGLPRLLSIFPLLPQPGTSPSEIAQICGTLGGQGRVHTLPAPLVELRRLLPCCMDQYDGSGEGIFFSYQERGLPSDPSVACDWGNFP